VWDTFKIDYSTRTAIEIINFVFLVKNFRSPPIIALRIFGQLVGFQENKGLFLLQWELSTQILKYFFFTGNIYIYI
jgi:hypothetical protein